MNKIVTEQDTIEELKVGMMQFKSPVARGLIQKLDLSLKRLM
jgi:hypothetical protein